MSEVNDEKGSHKIPTITEESNSHGDIKINHNVVASIVRIAALEVDGIEAVGGRFSDSLREIFKPDSAIRVSEDEGGRYEIEVRVTMRFGVELANVALMAQQNISEQVKRMTMKEVGKVDVIIESVRADGEDDPASADFQADTVE